MNDFFKNVEEYLKNSSMTKEEKVTFIKAAGEYYRQQVDREFNNYVRNQRIGAGLEIGSALIPGSVGVKAASKIIPKTIQKTIGRKLSNDIVAGALNGAISGGIYGFGEGIVENKNPLFNSAQKTTEGLFTGGLISFPISKINNDIRAKETLSINEMRKHWGIPYRQASANPQKALETLKKYQNGFVPNALYKENVGNVDLVWGDKNNGLQHIIERRNSQGINGWEFIDNIPNIVNKGTVYGKQNHNYRKYIGDDINEVSIRTNYILPNNDIIDRQWIPSAYEIYNNSQKKSQAVPVVQTLGTITPTNRIPLSDLRIINNINDSFLKSNLPKWVNSQTATLGQTINNNIQNNIPNFDFNSAIISRGTNQQRPKYDKIFTPEDIGKMTPQEFAKNEKIINEQLQQGLIIPTTKRKINYTNYKNPASGDNRIFSKEDIGDLSKDEFTQLENKIQAQLDSIGIPSNDELQSAGVIYVAPYTRSDGVQVKGHYRSR